MKKIMVCLLLLSCFLKGFGQLHDIEQLKLDMEKLLQMKMMLQSMYDGYITLTNGYNQLSSLAKGNFDLNKNYLDQLLQVAPQIKSHPVVQTILDKQNTLFYESTTAYNSFVKSGLFSEKNLFDTKRQFDQFKLIINKKLDQLNLVLTPGTLRMSDQERITAIDRIDKDVGDALSSVRALIREQNAVAAARAQQKKDNSVMRAWYGLKQ